MQIMQSNIPRCPKCAALMFYRIQNNIILLVCGDCLKTYKVLDTGQADNEVAISDNTDET